MVPIALPETPSGAD